MTLDRPINRVDHVERATSGAAVCDIPGSYVKRKEFSSESTLLHALNAGAVRDRGRAAEIVVVVCHWRRHVVVRVDDDGFAMNLKRALPELFIALRLGGDRGSDDYDKED